MLQMHMFVGKFATEIRNVGLLIQMQIATSLNFIKHIKLCAASDPADRASSMTMFHLFGFVFTVF